MLDPPALNESPGTRGNSLDPVLTTRAMSSRATDSSSGSEAGGLRYVHRDDASRAFTRLEQIDRAKSAKRDTASSTDLLERAPRSRRSR